MGKQQIWAGIQHTSLWQRVSFKPPQTCGRRALLGVIHSLVDKIQKERREEGGQRGWEGLYQNVQIWSPKDIITRGLEGNTVKPILDKELIVVI